MLDLTRVIDKCCLLPTESVPECNKEFQRNGSFTLYTIITVYIIVAVCLESLFLNSVWDRVIGLCYIPWKCKCGHWSGADVKCTTSQDISLVNKVTLGQHHCLCNAPMNPFMCEQKK